MFFFHQNHITLKPLSWKRCLKTSAGHSRCTTAWLSSGLARTLKRRRVNTDFDHGLTRAVHLFRLEPCRGSLRLTINKSKQFVHLGGRCELTSDQALNLVVQLTVVSTRITNSRRGDNRFVAFIFGMSGCLFILPRPKRTIEIRLETLSATGHPFRHDSQGRKRARHWFISPAMKGSLLTGLSGGSVRNHF